MAYCIWKSYKLKIEPLRIFEALRDKKNSFFLDSSLSGNSLGRYSFLGIDPFYILQTTGKDPLSALREVFCRYRVSSQRNNLPFLGGAVGYLSYDLGLLLEEKISSRPKPQAGIPDSFFAFYNTTIIIDHFKERLSIVSWGFPEKNHYLAKLLCEKNFKKICRVLSEVDAKARRGPGGQYQTGNAELKSSFAKEEYISAVKRAKEYIKNGDIYQVNLSQEFCARTDLSAQEIYKRLRRISPSSFSAYLDCGNFQILSSSPERFLKLEENRVITRPMKGTRRRSIDKFRDRKLKKALLDSPKDKAELIMIVDLERNDLGRVCNYGSIKVDVLRELEDYSTVFQTTATISGQLHKDKDRFDLLRACFPGGSITGCPKIRAMQIIEELEPHRRSIYTGCLGYLSFCGNMDFNILIRTILKKDDQLYFGAGGGIVADSKPEDEYQETLVKAKAMILAAGRGR